MTKTALITGISGQDGYYLACDLLEAGFRVVGTTRSLNAAQKSLGKDLSSRVELVDWDLVDHARLIDILLRYTPGQIYNLAALSSGEFMDRNPALVTDVNGVSVLRMLEAIRQTDPSVKFCQASSSEVFAASGVSPQDERTPRMPRSVYGAAKIYADNIIALYRSKYDLFACSAFLFNHESPRRGEGFVTQKIVQAAVRIKRGEQSKLPLGNLRAARDWGFAGDYMRAMRLMLNAKAPRDYIVATGRAHTVEELCDLAFGIVGLDYRDHIEVDARHYRATEPAPIIGNNERVRADLGWQPRISFKEMIEMMIEQAAASLAAA
jgi:GDPmannose 4,6-dehydratase